MRSNQWDQHKACAGYGQHHQQRSYSAYYHHPVLGVLELALLGRLLKLGCQRLDVRQGSVGCIGRIGRVLVGSFITSAFAEETANSKGSGLKFHRCNASDDNPNNSPPDQQ
jgi:hypothetical protein